jgi:hypothetical protein
MYDKWLDEAYAGAFVAGDEQDPPAGAAVWLGELEASLCTCTDLVFSLNPAGHEVSCVYGAMARSAVGVSLAAEVRYACPAGHLFLASFEEVAAGARCPHCRPC